MSKIFLFDLGNVLAKSLDNNELYRNLNCKISYEEFEKYWFYDDIVINAHKGTVTDEYHIKKLLEYCKSNLTVEEFYKIYNKLDNSMYQDTIDLINMLKNKGFKVGILSNLRLMDYDRYKDQINLLDLDYQFLSYEMGCIKPYKEIYEFVIKKCSCDPKNIVFFDDNINNVEGARKCGIDAYNVTGDNIKKVFGEMYDIILINN
ncbi:MAG: HAD-IA family hydrolase [Clostridia bacterium]|nr:HAD-IA family hydrolase [Clostridia bacterium]